MAKTWDALRAVPVVSVGLSVEGQSRPAYRQTTSFNLIVSNKCLSSVHSDSILIAAFAAISSRLSPVCALADVQAM